jgi:hypothetical protein
MRAPLLEGRVVHAQRAVLAEAPGRVGHADHARRAAAGHARGVEHKVRRGRVRRGRAEEVGRLRGQGLDRQIHKCGGGISGEARGEVGRLQAGCPDISSVSEKGSSAASALTPPTVPQWRTTSVREVLCIGGACTGWCPRLSDGLGALALRASMQHACVQRARNAARGARLAQSWPFSARQRVGAPASKGRPQAEPLAWPVLQAAAPRTRCLRPPPLAPAPVHRPAPMAAWRPSPQPPRPLGRSRALLWRTRRPSSRPRRRAARARA